MARRFSLSNACKDLRCLESMAKAVTVTTTMASAAKNSFAGAVAQGGAGGLCAPPDGFCGKGEWGEVIGWPRL